MTDQLTYLKNGKKGVVKRQGTTKAKVNLTYFQILKKQYLADIHTKVYMEDILIISWDHTGLKYLPDHGTQGGLTMEHKGALPWNTRGPDHGTQGGQTSRNSTMTTDHVVYLY